ncbi:hypothetical protein EK904_014217 [Melospiza melodia maxima]|nr:hypothetical protein EK904_014217 [Melospiza melodia maxima]
MSEPLLGQNPADSRAGILQISPKRVKSPRHIKHCRPLINEIHHSSMQLPSVIFDLFGSISERLSAESITQEGQSCELKLLVTKEDQELYFYFQSPSAIATVLHERGREFGVVQTGCRQRMEKTTEGCMKVNTDEEVSKANGINGKLNITKPSKGSLVRDDSWKQRKCNRPCPSADGCDMVSPPQEERLRPLLLLGWHLDEAGRASNANCRAGRAEAALGSGMLLQHK